MSAPIIDNEAIMASAGSGKTYQLAMRYIRLLAEGCMPDQICAMTFSRKAAGEIFGAIVENLCAAACSAEKADQIGGNIGMPAFKQDDFLRVLRVLLDNLQHSHVSTLDSFTVSIIRAFPMELGIGTTLDLTDNDGSAARLTRHQILSRVFNHRLVGPETQRKFYDAFKEATFGREERDMVDPLDKFIKDYWKKFRALPDPSAWGNPNLIWPDGPAWLAGSMKPADAAERLKEIISDRTFPHGSISKGLMGLVDKLAGHAVTEPWDKSLDKNKALDQLLAIPNLAAAESIEIDYYNEFTIGKEECELWAVLVTHLLGIELSKALQETAGIGRILEQYRTLYERVMRGGQMTFEDAQHLLTSANELSGGARVSRDSASRLYIDYRLNCRLDHWLLDEFQDTSDLQWGVVSNLIDEVMTDDSGQKRLFFVGDIKQAIHGWRGGNARLFGEILDKYKGFIQIRRMDESQRSSQPVLEMVNQVFRELPETVSADVSQRWAELWEDHKVAAGREPKDGYAGLLRAASTGEKGECLPADRYQVVGQLLEKIDPIRRNLSVAILVRGNDAAKELVDKLRAEFPAIPVCHEGRARICDNPVVAVLLSLIRVAAHPGDTLAWGHLEMSPLGKYIIAKELDPGKLARRVLTGVQEDGFETTIRHWGGRLELKEDDHFGRKRVADLAAAAAIFDAGDSRKCRDFLHFISDHETEEAGTNASVNVMTVHKAKGIGRDVVIVPDIEGGLRNRIDFALPRDPGTRKEEWALKMPRKLVVERDETLLRVRDQMLSEREFEELCVLYVALTRAKRATYVIIGDDSAAASLAGILKKCLVHDTEYPPWEFDGDDISCLYETGVRDWYQAECIMQSAAKAEQPELPMDFHEKDSLRPYLVRREPSRHDGMKKSAASLFNREDTDVMEFGSAIHELFEQVEWVEDADVDAIVSAWEPTSAYDEQVTRDVIEQFRKCMSSETIREQLGRPEGNVRLWREKRFEIVQNGQLVSGAFDRVTILCDAQGNVAGAAILDYKSSRVEESADIDARAGEYTSQMTTYREALAKILGLPENKIDLCLLFTRQADIRKIC